MPPKKTMSFEEWKKAGKPSGLTAKPKKEQEKKPAPKKKSAPKIELTATQKRIDRIYKDEEGAKKFAEAMKSRKRYTEAEARELQAKDAEMKKKKKEPVKKKEPAPVKMKQLKKIRKIMKDTRSGKKEKFKPTLDPITEEPVKKKKFVVKKK